MIPDDPRCSQMITAAPTQETKMRVVLGSRHPHDWRALGKLLARMRQLRRKSKATHTKLQELVQKVGYNIRANAWRASRRWVCRHGVFWLRAQGNTCPCRRPAPTTTDWVHARFMSTTHAELQSLVVEPFDLHSFCPIAELRVHMRGLGW